ncbi:MAG TPA: NUDIX domain-containing protein [Steroidobacteraceae bacterium]|nr:NUDIX domain-containing protein [Steroidobacteraceae bacterium]
MNTDFAVIIGRWQILQKGHLGLLGAALSLAPRAIVVIGSAWRARDSHNPFTAAERQQQFEAAMPPEDRARVSFMPVRDYFDEERWNEAVRAGIAKIAGNAAITLVGFRKDHSSKYLEHFPGWHFHEVEPESDISATDLRRIYFEAADIDAALTVIGNYVAPAVRNYLQAWAHLPAYRQCAAEHRAVMAYRAKYTDAVYLTADCVVTCSDHVLLIQRGGNIGHGQWACPGGFLEPRERFYEGALRELAEETGLDPLPARMKMALRGQAIFDHPGRSARGRIITTAFHFELNEDRLPEVQGKDDAARARWVPVAGLPQLEEQLFEDHACILDHFLGVFPRD